MVMLKAIGIALSTYTVLPVGHFTWEEKPMRWSICFLPLAGALTGALIILWSWLAALLGTGQLLFAAVAAALPPLFTGGIHLDGYLDTVDALSSHAPREKKLAIMKDPRAGAFSIIWGGVYFLLALGLLSELGFGGAVFILALGFMLSRTLTALSALCQKNARGEGLLVSFTERAPRKTARLIMAVLAALLAAAMLWLDPLLGGLALSLCAAALAACIVVTERLFGGVTGDTCGFQISVLELAMLAGVALGGFVRK